MIRPRSSGDRRLPEDVQVQLGPILSSGPCVTQLDLLRRTMARSTIRLVGQEPVIRFERDPEAIHDARVATRRLRSDLRAFRPLLDPDWCDTIRGELGWLGEILGLVRDPEVLADRLGSRIAAFPDATIGAGKVLLDEIEDARLDARRRLLADLGSARYAELVGRLVAGANRPSMQEEEAGRSARAAATLMTPPWRQVERTIHRLGPDPEDVALHATRIKVKRVRYAAEALAPAFGKPADRFAVAAKALQEVLGDHQDAVMTSDWLMEHGASADEPSVAFAAGRLAEHEARERDRCRMVWPKAWTRLERKKPFWT
jgi:CHAD domain-containing protein